MALESTDDLKDMPHVVILRTDAGCQVFDYAGPGCMERAHDFAMKLSHERPDGCVTVAMRYRQMYGVAAAHLAA